MATLYMLIGVPAAGKSTWIANYPFDWTRTIVVSTDNYIEKIAREKGLTYNNVFQSVIGQATKNLEQDIKTAVEHDHDIVWDQTNTSAGARRKKLAMIPKSYHKIAVVFPTPNIKELQRRQANRPGKTIPSDIMINMIKTFQMPTAAEGFDEIKVI